MNAQAELEVLNEPQNVSAIRRGSASRYLQYRALFKTTVLILSLVEFQVRFLLLQLEVRLALSRPLSIQERATWLHQSCSRLTRRLGIRLRSDAPLPTSGLIVSNHLSHLDILLYGSLGPATFVSKKDVRKWPLLGRLARNGGTIFVDRERTSQTADAARQIEDLLRSAGNALPVVLFPEGTSSDGNTVLPFRSPFFEPAIRAAAAITPAAIAYRADETDESTLTYWGDKVFFPHLYETLGRTGLGAEIRFAPARTFIDRKTAARATHDAVVTLRKTGGPPRR